MNAVELDSLQKQQSRCTELSPMGWFFQIRAAKKLVAAAQTQLVANQIDRDAGSGWPVSSKRYDAFFKIKGAEATMKISSVGSPEEESRNGLFIYIHDSSKDPAKQIVGLQTAKSPNSVEEDEALWLSAYTPKQLGLLASIVAEAEPIDSASLN